MAQFPLTHLFSFTFNFLHVGSLLEESHIPDMPFIHLFCPREKKLSSFLPGHLVVGGGFLSTLRGKGGRQAELEQKLLKEYHSLSQNPSQDPTHLLRQYLSTCHTLPYYGYAPSIHRNIQFQAFD